MGYYDYVSFCPKCKMMYGYSPEKKDEDKVKICGYKGCDGKIIHTKIYAIERLYIEEISKDREFLAAMNELRNNDIIAYKERMAQYKKIYEETHKPLPEQDVDYSNPKTQPTQHQSALQTNKIQCPYCKSTNTKKITAMDRISSNIMFGIFSKKRNKEWHCNECGSDF